MPDELVWFVRIVEAVSLVVGITIAYYAYLGYRRSKHYAILLSALGFGLLSIGAMVEGVLFEALNTPLLLSHALRAVIGMFGFFLLLESIRRMDH